MCERYCNQNCGSGRLFSINIKVNIIDILSEYIKVGRRVWMELTLTWILILIRIRFRILKPDCNNIPYLRRLIIRVADLDLAESWCLGRIWIQNIYKSLIFSTFYQYIYNICIMYVDQSYKK